MQRTKRVKVRDLHEGEILTTDIYVGMKKLIAEGSVVTRRLIDFLRNSNIELVEVKARKVTREVVGKSNEIMDDYLAILATLNIEQRYGKAIQNVQHVENVTGLFHFLMENDVYRTKLEQLREHDYYTFLHAIDVFTLCALFAKQECILDFEQKALGFLFHDIGKLKSPKDILQKTTKLTKYEMEVMQRHTVDGQKILEQMNLEGIGYLAKSHHESSNGRGYPESIRAVNLPKEVRMLQLVDTYLALTLKRAYKDAVLPYEAIQMMYRNIDEYDEEILHLFTEFIGIYPENAIVVLSNGTYASIEEVNQINPLLPIVKQIDTNNLFQISPDFSVKINKMLSYTEECSDQLFAKFSDALIKGKSVQTKKQYDELKEMYRPYEWYTHILIPMFKISNVLMRNNLMSETRKRTITKIFSDLLVETTYQLAQISRKSEVVLLVVDEQKISPLLISLFEGMLQSEEICPLIIRNKVQMSGVEKIIETCQIQQIFILGREMSDYHAFRKFAHTNCFTTYEIEKILGEMCYADLQKESFKMQLKTYI